jgi:hypothetical protein
MLAAWGALVTGCASDPLARMPATSVVTVSGDGFVHRAVLPVPPPADSTVHLYIEGDGRAFVGRRTVAGDPTPREAPALELMTLDPGYTAWLGRPCYFGLARNGDCAPVFWTDARYGERVIASMVAAKRALLGHRPVVLIGHSGGGTIAWLMAARMPEVTGVLTIAANLNVGGWTTLHGYTPLHQSLDPANQPALPARIRQRHLAGERDRVVPAFLIQDRVPPETLCVVRNFDHGCCWDQVWPDALGLLDARIGTEVSALLCSNAIAVGNHTPGTR